MALDSELTRPAADPERPKRTRRRLWRSSFGGVLVGASLGLLVLVVLVAVFAPLVAPYDPTAVAVTDRLKPPFFMSGGDASHLLGTDALGRDVFTRLVYGARITLGVAASVVVLSGVVGIALGVVAGFYGGWVDSVVGRLTEIQLAFPNLLLAISFIAAVGPGPLNVVIALSMAGWVTFARVTRAELLLLREREFILAARLLGRNDLNLTVRHLLPNVATSAIVVASFAAVTAILTESSLSFLGLGVGPPTPTWGGILSEGRQYLSDGWWVTVTPGLAIVATLLSINLIGDWLRDRYDPRLSTI